MEQPILSSIELDRRI